MILLSVFVALTIGVVAALLWPLLRRPRVAADRLDYDLAIYRDQLAELERDRERGLIAPDQSDAARSEIERRMLAAASAAERPGPLPSDLERSRWTRLVASLAVLILVPLGAALLYAFEGAPRLPGQPYAERQNDPDFKLATLAAKLAETMQHSPSAQGYGALGLAYMRLGRYAEAVEAYGRAVQMGATSADALSSLGEAVAMASGGSVIPEARRDFERALAADPSDPRARFYLGVAESEAGHLKEAVAIWRDMVLNAPPDASWLSMVRDHIEAASRQGAFDPTGVAPHPPVVQATPAAPAESVGAPAGQEAMIRAMVARLAARMQDNPDDLDGWLRLARSYRVLGQLDLAKDALAHAVKLKPDDPAVKAMGAEIAAAEKGTATK